MLDRQPSGEGEGGHDRSLQLLLLLLLLPLEATAGTLASMSSPLRRACAALTKSNTLWTDAADLYTLSKPSIYRGGQGLWR